MSEEGKCWDGKAVEGVGKGEISGGLARGE